MTKREMYSRKNFWLTKWQIELYGEILDYMQTNNLNKSDLAKKWKFSKSYISQLLNGNFNHKIEKVVELSLLMDKAPITNYIQIGKFIEQEEAGINFPFKFFQYYSMTSPAEVDQIEKSRLTFNFELDYKPHAQQATGVVRAPKVIYER